MNSNKLLQSSNSEDHFQQKIQENIHIVFWLLKDFAWVMHFRAFGMLMAIPTFILSVYMAVKSLSHCFDVYYKWMFLQIRYVIKSTEGTETQEDLNMQSLRFNDVFQSDYARTMMDDSKWAIMRFLVLGKLSVSNLASLDYRELVKGSSDLYHNIAIACWILGNGTWMVGEFYFEDSIRYLAIPFFLLGLFFIVWYYLVVLNNLEKQKASEVEA
jgi:hypothetical protein